MLFRMMTYYNINMIANSQCVGTLLLTLISLKSKFEIRLEFAIKQRLEAKVGVRYNYNWTRL